MSNKEKLNEAIEQDINMKDYYNEIIRKIEDTKMKKKNNMWKWSLVPICLVIISGTLLLNYQSDNKIELENQNFVEEKYLTLNINEIQSNYSNTFQLDIDIKIKTSNEDNFPQPYENEINIPKDLNNIIRFIVYTRENMDSKDYNILNNYIIEYSNDKDRTIKIAYSKDHKPIRDYYFSYEGSKATIINGVELKIYKLEDIYYTELNYNGYNFDIETSKITEQELATFLLSILK